ncbi:MAG: YHYH protein [Erythrobacter sp.]|nr:YHYH protein [Erythrobacter sp.]
MEVERSNRERSTRGDNNRFSRLGFAAISACTYVAGCAPAANDTAQTSDPVANAQTLAQIIEPFDKDAIVGEPSIVPCTLSGGTEAQCLSITLKPEPAAFKIGPWCPRNIADGPELSGIWLDDGKVYDADGKFIQNLSRFYDDDRWQLFDPETGKINVTDTEASCQAAARPDDDPAYQNHCVECQIDYLPADQFQTYVIPLSPVQVASVEPRVGHDGVGIAYSGVRLDASAPLDAILDAHTLAPFDDCGGHVNPNVGYHIHAVTDCLKSVPTTASHAPKLGLALDGYPILARLNLDGKEPEGLDQCRGHASDGLGYHYHAGATGSNAILGCHKAETGCVLTSATQTCDASQTVRRGPPGGGRPPRPDG